MIDRLKLFYPTETALGAPSWSTPMQRLKGAKS